jgi:DNA-binding transcriptional ArsR family regulator
LLAVNSGIDSLHRILKDETRRKILLLLRAKENLSYTELIGALGINSTGKLNYHLKVLGDLLSKAGNGRYVLTEKGALASRLLSEFPEKVTNQSRLNVFDSSLIGLAGFLVAFINPFVWGIFYGFSVLRFVLLITYAISAPGLVMWRLATNRTSFHDFYELFKPAIVPALLFALAFVLFFALNRQIGDLGPPALLFLGIAPFLGILLAEALYRTIDKR